MNTPEFYELYEDDLGINFTTEDLIPYLKLLSASHLFDIICDNCLGFVEDTISCAAERMIEKRDEARALERLIAQNSSDL